MAVITLLDAQLAYGHVALLDHADLSLESQERVGLIGRNGSGKSSLLRILAQLEKPDDGTLQLQQGLRVCCVAQEPVLDPQATVLDAVSDGLAVVRDLIAQDLSGAGDHDALQNAIEMVDGWNWEQRVLETLTSLKLDGDALIATLSGGTKKRVALAQALVARPDVLLLDEPTNHLDLDAIVWLQDLLRGFKGSVIMVSHDRAFLDAVCSRIVELDRGRLLSYPGNFAAYQQHKLEQMAQEAVVNAKADRLLAAEEVWIRKGVEARRTRAQGRITRLEALRANRASRRDALGRVKLDIDSGARSGKLVAELDDVSKGFVDSASGAARAVIRNFSATILRGDKVGIMGPNGAGKTTLLKLMLGELQPDSGRVRQGANLQVAYFDQMRDALDLDAALEDFISPGSEWITIGNQRKHVKSYLGDFLFSPARASSPVRSLSGGERNRLLLARLFARPANVLVLDEPTNDLDIDTLELLEDLLQNYDGTVFLVSHDRTFLDNVVTSTIAYEGQGAWREYEGGVQDWLTQSQRARALVQAAGRSEGAMARAQIASQSQAATALAPAQPAAPGEVPAAPAQPDPRGVAAAAPAVARKKLSYKEQRELEALPERIEALEQEQAEIRVELADGSLYTIDPDRAVRLQTRDTQIDEELHACLERWEALGHNG